MTIIINPYTVPSFCAGIISFILGVYALYKNPKDRSTQVFFILMLGITLWSLTPLLVQAQTYQEYALFWAKISNIGLLVIPIALFHFSFLYKRKKTIEFIKIAGIYILAIIMIILLLSTNLFFTMAEDVLIDGDGAKTMGRGEGNFSEKLYYPLSDEDLKLFTFIDTNNDSFYTIENRTIEPLIFNNITIVGYPEDHLKYNITPIPLDKAENSQLIWYVDKNHDGRYSLNESIYLENGDGNQKLVFNYIAGPYYYLLILFFFGFIIATTLNLFLLYRSTDDLTIKKPVLYLIMGLIAIVIFILTQSFLAVLIPLTVLDGAIALIIAIFFTVAVLKYNIVDIKLILRKSMFYSMASLVVVVCFVLVEEGMEILFAELAFSGSMLSGVVAAFVALISFSIIKRGLKHQVDRLFPAVRYLDKEYQRRITAYKETLLAMLADSKISRKEKNAIDILRNLLDISEKEHENLMKTIKLNKNISLVTK